MLRKTYLKENFKAQYSLMTPTGRICLKSTSGQTPQFDDVAMIGMTWRGIDSTQSE